MSGLNVGEKVKVRYTEGESPFEYTLDVEVTAIRSSYEFKGPRRKSFCC